MTIANLNDHDLLRETKQLTSSERAIVTKILRHLREIEHRRLFADLGYRSLFEYAVKELKYSESQASRRIQVMRLIKELPQVENSIASGELSLSNVSQAQSLFNNIKKQDDEHKPVPKSEKLGIVNSLKNKSTREGQIELLKHQPEGAVPNDRETQFTPTKVKVTFVMGEELKAKLEEVRALLGERGATMNYAELMDAMASLSIAELRAKKFGKKRARGITTKSTKTQEVKKSEPEAIAPITPAPQVDKSTKPKPYKNPRYIPKQLQYEVWQRDGGCCRQCQGKMRLQIDHIKPLAMGGETTLENLRLLCFSCNQRAAMRVFGLGHMLKKSRSRQASY